MYSYKNSKGIALGTKGWKADRKNGSFSYTGLWKDGRVVALLVVKSEEEDEEFSDMSDRLKEIGDEIVTACNAHAGLVEALQAVQMKIRFGQDLNGADQIIVEALAKAGVK